MLKKAIKYSLPFLAIVFLSVLLIYKISEDGDFLSSLRYKNVTDWNESGTQYYLSISQRDSLYSYSIRFSNFSERWITHWIGDTTYNSKLSCGVLSPEKQKEIDIWGYDSTIILFKKDKILPQSVGLSEVYIKYPNSLDTLFFEVSNNGGTLIVNEKAN